MRGVHGAMAIGLLALLLTWLYIDTTYLFNPVTFRQDDVTYLPWDWYKRDLQIEYLVIDNPKRLTVAKEETEVRYLFAALKQGLAMKPVDKVPVSTAAGRFDIDVRDQSGGIVLHATGYMGQDYIVLGVGGKGDVPVRLTDELQQLIATRLEQAVPVQR